MKVTYNWLKDFVDIRMSAEKLAEQLTMAGLEVTAVEARDGDFVFEIEITSNRPDWLSVIGVAREVAAITGKKIKIPACVHRPQSTVHRQAEIRRRSTVDGRPRLTIKIESKKDCPLYIGTLIAGVKVGPSPEWLKSRLELIGCRSVNNIVDITNYCLFETGEPLRLMRFPAPIRFIGRRLVEVGGIYLFEDGDVGPSIALAANDAKAQGERLHLLWGVGASPELILKASLAVLPKPGFQGGNPELPATIVGKIMFGLRLFAEVFILGPFGFGQNRADDLVTFEGDFFSDLWFHRLSSWVGFW